MKSPFGVWLFGGNWGGGSTLRKPGLHHRDPTLLFGNCFNFVLEFIVESCHIAVHSDAVQRYAGDLAESAQESQVLGRVNGLVWFAAQGDQDTDSPIEFQAVKEFSRKVVHQWPGYSRLRLRTSLAGTEDVAVGLQLLDRFWLQFHPEWQFVVGRATDGHESEVLRGFVNEINGRGSHLEHVVTRTEHPVGQ